MHADELAKTLLASLEICQEDTTYFWRKKTHIRMTNRRMLSRICSSTWTLTHPLFAGFHIRQCTASHIRILVQDFIKKLEQLGRKHSAVGKPAKRVRIGGSKE